MKGSDTGVRLKSEVIGDQIVLVDERVSSSYTLADTCFSKILFDGHNSVSRISNAKLVFSR